MAFEEQQARIFAGLSISEWDALPGIHTWIDPEVGGYCKADFVMLYRMNNWIPAAQQDVAAREMERNNRRRPH